MIILDTHVWIWWSNESRKLSDKAREAIQEADAVGIPAIACWELAMLVSKNKLQLAMDVQIWIEIALQRKKVCLLPLSPEISVLSTRLPGVLHGDPADRLIATTSLAYNIPLLSADDKIQNWGYIKIIW